MTMREKMARAIFMADNDNRSWSDAPEADHTVYGELADAALAAMEEPTEAMVRAAGVGPACYGIWRAMIGAVKGEG